MQGLQHQVPVVASIHCGLLPRFPVFFKQRDNKFYRGLSYVMPATVMRIPYSLTEAVVWSVLVYFEVNLAPDAGRCTSTSYIIAIKAQALS